MADKKQALIILGMHRSGTSAVTRICNLLGAELGDNLMKAAEGNNETGFWEDDRIVQLHDRILALTGRSWDDIRPMPAGWHQDAGLGDVKAEMSAYLSASFNASPLWAVKDPRHCRLLTVWFDILDEAGVQPRFLFVTRHPDEVANSLERRDMMQKQQGYLLWLRHLIEAEVATRGHPRAFISYDQVMNNWASAMTAAAPALAISWPNDIANVTAEVESFINPDLRHHSLGSGTSADAGDLVRDVFRSLVDGGINGPNQSVVDDVVTRLAEIDHLMHPVMDATMNAAQALRERDEELDRRQTNLDLIAAERDSLRETAQKQASDISALQDRAREVDARDAHRAREVDARDAQLNELRAQSDARIADLTARSDGLFHRNQELHDQILRIYSSTSWKISAPVRLISRLFGRG